MRFGRGDHSDDAVRQFIEQGGELDALDREGSTILMVAAGWASGHPQALLVLVRSGAGIHVRGAGGLMALHAAARAGNLNAVRALLELGADPRALNDRGETPLDLVEEARVDGATAASLREALSLR